jgi:hypothetical protein
MPRSTDKRNIEQQTEMLLQVSHLPDSYSEGAKKAFEQFQVDYEPDEGRRIFFQKALELGSGDSLKDIVNNVYKNGATLPDRRKREVRINLNRTRPAPPTVTILRRPV